MAQIRHTQSYAAYLRQHEEGVNVGNIRRPISAKREQILKADGKWKN